MIYLVSECFVLSFSLTVCQWHLRSVGFGENSHVRVRCPSLPKPVSLFPAVENRKFAIWFSGLLRGLKK